MYLVLRNSYKWELKLVKLDSLGNWNAFKENKRIWWLIIRIFIKRERDKWSYVNKWKFQRL